MLLEKDILNIKSLLTIILTTTNRSTQFLADSYLLKHHSAVSRWRNDKAVPNTEDLSNIVEFTISETTITQRKLIKDQITSLINDSTMDKDTQASVLAIDDFSSFLFECLKICACKLSYSVNAHKLNRNKNDSTVNVITYGTCITDKIYIPSPVKPTKNFVARKYELEKLNNMINEKNATLLINGLGGIGKTEICRKYFWDYKDTYAFAGWINYTNNLKESVISQISVEGLKFSKSTDMDNKYSKIIMYLNKLPSNSLLVIDNLETNKEDDINTILSLPIKILATSRESFEAFTSLTVDVLNEKSCIDLFYKYFIGKRDDDNLKKIIALAGNHTLTIELLAKTANNAAIEAKELYEKLVDCGFDLSKELKEPLDISMKNSKENKPFFEHLLMVFNMSNLNENEKYVLTNMSILPSTYIEIQDLNQWFGLSSKDCINSLVKKGWLKQEGFSVYMNRIIQEITRHKLKPTYDKCFTLINNIEIYIKGAPGTRYNLLDRKRYVPIAESIIKYVYEGNEFFASFYSMISLYYFCDCKYKKAQKYEYKSYKIRKKIHGENHVKTANCYSSFVRIFYSLGKFDLALAYLLKEIHIMRLQFGEESSQVCFSYGNLSTCYNIKGDYNAALEYIFKSSQISSKLFKKNHTINITTYNNIGNIYIAKGDLKQAEDYTLLALQTQLEIEKGNNQSTAVYYRNLSNIYYLQGNLSDAFKNQVKAIKIFKAIFKEAHTDLANSYSIVSMIYAELGKLEKALKYQIKALKMLKNIVKNDNFFTAGYYEKLSVIYLKKGNFQQSMKNQLLAMSVYRKSIDDEHQALLNCNNNLSMIYKGMKKYNLALENQLKVIEMRKKRNEENHPDTIYTNYILSTIYLDLKDYDNAYIYVKKAYDALKLLDFDILHGDEIIQNFKRMEDIQLVCNNI